jgi:uncharacterized membrane protein
MKSPHPPAWTRFFRRLFQPFLSHTEKSRIASVIEDIDKKTSAEIHVHIVYWMGRRDPLKLAQKVFLNLKLHETKSQNGVLILVSHLDHRFVIWGDRAVHEALGDALWQKASQTLIQHFKARHYAEGIIACAQELGQELEKHFPRL